MDKQPPGQKIKMQTKVVFQPPQPVGYRVVVRGDKQLAGEGLFDGDLVIGISGQRFSADEQMWTQLSSAASSHDAQVSLLVERGGQQIEVSLTGAELQWNMSQGVFSEAAE